ncbi:OmpP1/FadL family transporter [Actibacterium sp. D379-3]
MKNTIGAAGITLLMATTTASGGNQDLSGQSITPLFETGNHVELGMTIAQSDVSGKDFLGGDTGEAAGDPTFFTAAIKADLNEKLSYAIILDKPFYAEAAYRGPSIYQGLTAEINTSAVTTLLRYKFDENWSVYGGLRAQSHKTSLYVPLLMSPNLGPTPNYNFTTDTAWAFGYTVGAAYEIPKIHLRASLTYHSSIEHEHDVVEMGVPGTWKAKFPESVNFEFQTGLNPQTFIFGGARWVNWDDVKPTLPVSGFLLQDVENLTTYRLGAGRIFSPRWIGVVELGYEPGTNSRFDPLYPVDGFTSVALAAIYNADKAQYTVGVNYLDIGDAVNPATGSWTGNSAWGLGAKVAYKF